MNISSVKMLRKIIDFFKENKEFASLFFISLAARLIFYLFYQHIWWDSAVYVGMGKYIFSSGGIGLWEDIRPLGLPLLYGLFWKSGINVILAARIFALLCSMGIIFFSYEIGNKIFGKWVGIFSAAMLSFSPTFFYYNFRMLTEIPGMFFVFFALYLFLQQRFFWSGLILGVSFIIKFPLGIFFAVLGIAAASYLTEKSFFDTVKKCIFITGGFLTSVLPVLISYKIKYDSFLYPFIEASEVIDVVLGCNYINAQEWYFYFLALPKENFFAVFALAGLFFIFKRFNHDKLAVLLCFAMPFAYFNNLNCKEIRYALVFMPFLYMIASVGMVNLAMMIRKKYRFVFSLGFLLIVILAGFILFDWSSVLAINYNVSEPAYVDEFYRFFPDGVKVLSTSPFFVLYSDVLLEPYYYNPDRYADAEIDVDYVFINICDIPCMKGDIPCENSRDAFLENLNDFRLMKNETYNNCEYLIYKNDKSE